MVEDKRREEHSHEEHHHLEETVKLLFRGLIPVVFLVSGIVILALRIPGWSLLVGLPITVFGAVFLVYTYDEVVRGRVYSKPSEVTECSVCGKPTLLLPGQDPKDTICSVCKKDIRKGEKTG